MQHPILRYLILFALLFQAPYLFGEDFDDLDRAFEQFRASPDNEKPAAKKSSAEGATCPTCNRTQRKNTASKADAESILLKTKEAVAKTAPPSPGRKNNCISCGRYKVGNNGNVILETASENTWAKFPEIASYSDSEKTQRAIDTALKNSNYKLSQNGTRLGKRSPNFSTGWCFRHVKRALLGGGLVDRYLAGNRVDVPKDMAENELRKSGFINLLKEIKYRDLITNPASAPKGAILIFEGGQRGGHIEIKTDYGTNGTYVSDHQAPRSIIQNELAGTASRGYRLIGVMVKPGV